MSQRTFGSVTFLLAVTISTSASPGADWANWRGPNHDGISPETGFKKEFTAPLKLVWDRTVGSAFSSFACVGDRVYTCGTQDKQQVLFCLDVNTGAIQWQSVIEPEYREGDGGDGARCTPAVSDGRVYVQGALGKLLCLDAATGSEIWQHSYNSPPRWGYSGSVLIEGDLAIVTAGAGDAALEAFNKVTGKPAWTCGQGPVGYSTPYPFTFKDKRYITGFSGNSAVVAEAKTGREVWSMPWKTDWDVNAASPIYHDGHLFFSSGYRHGAVVLRLEEQGANLKTTEIWQSLALRNKFQSSVLYEGHLYASDDQGLKCVEFMTGTQKWYERGTKDGTLVVADGHLVILTENGELLIAPATPTEFKPTTKSQILDGLCWTVPVLYRGRLYARSLERLVCFDLK